MLTDYQKAMIKKAQAHGRGYAIFATNIEKQGWCSPKQEQALSSMVCEADYRKNNWRNKKYGRKAKTGNNTSDGANDYGCKHSGDSDAEAMQSGDYF